MNPFVDRSRKRRAATYRNRYVQADGGPTFFVDSRGRLHLVVRGDGRGGLEQPLRVEAKDLEALGALADPVEVPVPQTLRWATKADAEASLERLARVADQYAQKQIDWYGRNTPPARIRARTTRVFVIAATAAAGVIPILSQLLESNGRPQVAPAWSSVALALAAALVGLDRYFGFSQSWMRYTVARQQLEGLQERFAIDWSELCARLEDPPSHQQVHAVIARARAYVTDIGAIVDRETAEWIRAMSAVLREEESAMESDAERQAERRGGSPQPVAGDEQVKGEPVRPAGA